MIPSSRIPFLISDLVVVEAVVAKGGVSIAIQSAQTSATCSKCGVESTRVHSKYQRQVQDTPLGLFIVRLQIRVRRFRCDNPDCKRRTFAEQYPDLVERRRR